MAVMPDSEKTDVHHHKVLWANAVIAEKSSVILGILGLKSCWDTQGVDTGQQPRLTDHPRSHSQGKPGASIGRDRRDKG